MKKAIIILSLVFLTLVFFYQKNQKVEEVGNNEKKLKIATSFYPLYFFTKEITQDRAEVINLTKVGGDPHDFEPSPKDILAIQQSQLLIANGAFFETWLDKFSDELGQGELKVLKVAEKLATIKNLDEHTEEGGEETDPHIWLDPVLAQNQVTMISQELQNLDPNNANYYQEKSAELIQKLENLHQEFLGKLQNCQNHKIITSHTAFAYMAKQYGFEQIAIQGLNPDEDPSPAKIAELSKLAEKEKIEYIFFETLVSPKIAQTIAKEAGAKTLVFNPLEGLTNEEERNGKNYFSIQRENLNNLSLALNCQS